MNFFSNFESLKNILKNHKKLALSLGSTLIIYYLYKRFKVNKLKGIEI